MVDHTQGPNTQEAEGEDHHEFEPSLDLSVQLNLKNGGQREKKSCSTSFSTISVQNNDGGAVAQEKQVTLPACLRACFHP